MYEIGRVCIKTAGRDAKNPCVIVDKMENGYVLIDGNVRRRKCNIKHLEPLDIILKIKKDAKNEEVIKALEEAKVPLKGKRAVRRKPKTIKAKEDGKGTPKKVH